MQNQQKISLPMCEIKNYYNKKIEGRCRKIHNWYPVIEK